MIKFIRRVLQDIFVHRRYIPEYAVAFFALYLCVIGLTNLPYDDFHLEWTWATILTALSILIFKITEPAKINSVYVDLDSVLKDRPGYSGTYNDYIANAKHLKILAVSAVTAGGSLSKLLDILQKRGHVQILIHDPRDSIGIALLDQQLDKTTNLAKDLERFEAAIEGNRELHKYLKGKNPTLEIHTTRSVIGFGLTIVDTQDESTRRLSVEFWGYKNKTIDERMHIEINRSNTIKWYDYWDTQFERLWEQSTDLFPSIDTSRATTGTSTT